MKYEIDAESELAGELSHSSSATIKFTKVDCHPTANC
jgi:hypothetical protein